MAKITKTFDYVIPDEYLGQTGTGTASWTYEGPAFLWVFVRNSDGAWLNGQSFIPARTATDQQGPAAIRAGLDETAILLDPANDDTDALIASLLLGKDTGEAAGYAQKEFAFTDANDGRTVGEVYYKHATPIPPDHAYEVGDIKYDLAGGAWIKPFPFHKPWMSEAQHKQARDGALQGATTRLNENRTNLTAAQISAADAHIAALTNLYTKFAGIDYFMIPFPNDPTTEWRDDYDYNTDPEGLL